MKRFPLLILLVLLLAGAGLWAGSVKLDIELVNHDHLICLDCNEVLEFCDPRIQSIQEMVAEIYQFAIKHHALHLYGHCQRPDCPTRPENTEAERDVVKS